MNFKMTVVLSALVALACGGVVDQVEPGSEPAQQGVAVQISPLVVTVMTGGTVAFAASVTGTANTAVSWSVQEGAAGGTVSGTGVYAAPAVEGSYHVLVSSAADSTKTAAATITVAAAPVTSFGTGTRFAPSYMTTVTGGGAMPSISTGYTAACAGDGTTDDTACLKSAAATAASQGKPLLVPYTSRGYLVSSPITIATSVIGVGSGPPLIFAPASTGNGARRILLVSGYQGPGLWITNLHLRGSFTTTRPSGGESDYAIGISNSKNVTIMGNLIENPAGDCIYLGGQKSVNIRIEGNTLRNPYRCAVALIYSDLTWVGNNLIEKQYNYVSAIDYEPNADPQGDSNSEVAYNKFVMDNRLRGTYGSDGRASSAYQNSSTTSPGGNLYLHHNYGTFGVGWWMPGISYKGGNGDWYNIVNASNVEGSTIPN